jgi:hypothetical protein
VAEPAGVVASFDDVRPVVRSARPVLGDARFPGSTLVDGGVIEAREPCVSRADDDPDDGSIVPRVPLYDGRVTVRSVRPSGIS